LKTYSEKNASLTNQNHFQDSFDFLVRIARRELLGTKRTARIVRQEKLGMNCLAQIFKLPTLQTHLRIYERILERLLMNFSYQLRIYDKFDSKEKTWR
jgi:hypothetical protein